MWAIKLRRAAQSAVLSILGVVSVGAQQVTLPTARTVGPSPATRQLLAYFNELATWYKPATPADSLAQAMLDYVRYRAILAPLDDQSLPVIARQPTMATVLSELFARDGAVVPAGFFPNPSTVRDQVREKAVLTLMLTPNVLNDGMSLPESLLRRIAHSLEYVEVTSASAQMQSAIEQLGLAEANLAGAKAAAANPTDRTANLAQARSHLAQATSLLATADTNAEAAVTDAATARVSTANPTDAKQTLDQETAQLKQLAGALPREGSGAGDFDTAIAGLKSISSIIKSTTQQLVPDPGDSTDATLRKVLEAYAKSPYATSRARATYLPPIVVKASPRDTAMKAVEALEIVNVASAIEIGLSDQKLVGKLDTIARLAQLVAIERNIDGRTFFPLHDTEDARVFWRQQGVSPLNLGYTGLSNTSASAMTEIASPLLHFIRLSLNTTIATSSNKSGNTGGGTGTGSGSNAPAADAAGSTGALSQFLTGGGQFNLSGAVPVISLQHREESASAVLLLNPRAGGTIASAGTVQQDPTAYADLGTDLQLSWADVTENIGFVAQARYGIPVLSQTQAASMGVPKNFGYATWAGGLLFNQKFLMTVGRAAAGPAALKRVKAQIGVTVLGAAK